MSAIRPEIGKERSVKKHRHGGDLSALAERYGLKPGDFIDFSVNVNPLGPPPGLSRVFAEGLRLAAVYPDPYCEGLQEAAAGFLGVSPDQVVFANGAIELIYLVMQALRPKTVLIPGPTFREYEIAARIWQARIRHFRLSPRKNFVPGLAQLIRAARGADLVFLCNPNNPTGNLIPAEVLQPFLRFCAGEGIFVVLDESFLFFHPRREELTCTRQAERNRNLLVLHSLTKFYAIPGLRVGCGVGHPDTIAFLSGYLPPWRVNGIAQAAVAAALGQTEYAAQTRSFVKAERELLAAALRRIPGITVFPSEANYLLLRLEGAVTASLLADRLGRRGIVIRNCSNFAFLDERYVRVAVRDRENNNKLLEELAAAVR
ncbi:MAG TPA: threonine-phosphate decarboxylase [Syntrophomonadaceae bacterium]|nr:threonine-phosphate decarboxylase [Syntrophomonadaceae bacterium]